VLAPGARNCAFMLDDTKPNPLATTDALILCGGAGTRLRPVISDKPKGLAPLGGRPFLDILVEDLLEQGFRRLIFCVGYLKEQIIGRYRDRDDAEYLFSEEDAPLGTGGAIQNALPLVCSDPFLVSNGDSFCTVDLGEFYLFHHRKEAIASLVLARVDERHDGGIVCLDETQRILSFVEKSGTRDQQHCFVNAGMYLMQKETVELHRESSPLSLEYDVFPALVKSNRCFGFVVGSQLFDIGTPERYRKANGEYLK